MNGTPKPPNGPDPRDPRDPGAMTAPSGAAGHAATGDAAAPSPPSRVQGAWGATPNDADLTVPDLADDAMNGADEPLLFAAEDALAEADARATLDEEAILAATDTADDTDDGEDASDEESLLLVVMGGDDGEDEAVPPTDAGTIDAVADADTALDAADLELYTEITSTEGMTDAEMFGAVEIAAAMQDAVVESAIAEALGEAAELAADTGEAVIVVVEDEIVGIASPADLDRDNAAGSAAPGVFGSDIAAHATDADDPLVQMLHVQKRGSVDAGVDASDTTGAVHAAANAPALMGDEVDIPPATGTTGTADTTDTTDTTGAVHAAANAPALMGDEVDAPPATGDAAMPATAAQMDDEGDEVDADAALSGMVGSMAVAPPTMDDTDDAGDADGADADDPAPGVFGSNITAYATDADDPAMRMLNVQKRGQLDRDEARDLPPLRTDATDTLEAMRDAAGMRSLMGESATEPPADAVTAANRADTATDAANTAITNHTSDGRESDPLDEGGIVTTTPEPDDTGNTDDARPLLDETTDDTAPAPENDPEPAADMATEDPAPLLGEEMLDVVEGEAEAGDDAAPTASAPPFKAVQETGRATDAVRLAAPSGGGNSGGDRETAPALVAPVADAEDPDLQPFAGRAPATSPGDVQGGDQPVDTADEGDTPPAPEPTVQFIAGDESADEAPAAAPSLEQYAAAATEESEARENSDASRQSPLPTSDEAAPPAPATPPPADEPPGELTEEELEEARVDTDEGQTTPEPVDEEPATGGQSQSQRRSPASTASVAPAATGGGMGAETAAPTLAPAPAAAVLTPEELAQAGMDNDSGTVSPQQPATDAPSATGGANAFATSRVWHHLPLMTADDLYLFNEGTHTRLYEKLGSHPRTVDGVAGTHFAVWAPNARTVSVVGPFNDWIGVGYDLALNGGSGIWEGFIPGLGAGTPYKYHIASNYNMYEVDKTDPFGIHAEVSPRTASVVWDADYAWQDDEWMRERGERNGFAAPMSIYEVHIGSWRRVPEDGNRPLTYRELAPQLADYVQECGFTHVEFLPVMEHPFYGSWGYQVTGYFAPTSRYGMPQDFAYLVDYLHGRGIGVILDWVPSHFPTDQHGLDYFDGTHLYEHADPRQGFHPDWKSDVFNYGRNEVRSFLMSSATYWLDRFHADGLRVDGVASMLYLDYSRNPGEWVPNRHGGRENLEAVSLLKQLNTSLYSRFPDIQTVAEESTSWPMVSRPTYIGGLGFGMKWDMGWMHDTLEYMALDPIHRQYHHNALTFRMLYSFVENFVLPLSHDEVVYLKGSLIRKMGGDDDWQKFANLRLLFGYQWAQSGKKLLFMGGEFAQWGEWNHDASLDWHLLDAEPHRGIKAWIGDLNRIYRDVPALHERDFDRSGFEWIDANDSAQSMASFVRYGDDREDPVVIAANFTPVPRHNYRLGVPFAGRWNEILNSDAGEYGGSGVGNMGGVDTVPAAAHGRPQSLTVTVPPLGIVFFRRAYGS